MSWGIKDLYGLFCNLDEKYLLDIYNSAWSDPFRAQLENDLPFESSGNVVMHGMGLWADFGWTAQFHKFIGADSREPYHTHQAQLGVRYILLGGYDEEVLVPLKEGGTRMERRMWRRGQVGLIQHHYNHRVCHVLPEPTMSLWIRGPDKYPVTWRWDSGAVKTVSIKGEIL